MSEPIPARSHGGREFIGNPLSLAIACNHFPIAEFLVSKGAEVSDAKKIQQGPAGPIKYLYSSLDLAAFHEEGRVEFFELLIKKELNFFQIIQMG